MYKKFFARCFCFAIAIFITFSLFSVSAYSSEYLNWKKYIGVQIGSLYDVAFGNGVFIAVGWDGAMASSKDGTTWTCVNPGTTDHLKKIVWNGSYFLAIGTRTTLISKDGMNWSVKKFDGEYAFKNLVWTGDFFILTCTKNEFYSTEATQVFVSENGMDWTKKSVLDKRCIKDIIWKDGKAIAVGSYDVIRGFIATSTDLITWRINDCTRSDMLFDIVSNDKEFFVYGSCDTIFKSEDGYNWKLMSYSGVVNPLNRDYFWDGHKFIAVGDGSKIKISQDGVVWKELVVLENTSQLDSLIYANNKYVAVGDRSIVTSDDSISWEVVSKTENFYLNDIVWNGETFVAVGINGMILTSPDGLVWTRRESNTNDEVFSVTWDTKKFIAMCQSSVLLSCDGINWTVQDIDFTFRNACKAFNGSTYVSMGKSVINENEAYYSFYSSSDGITWTENDPILDSAYITKIAWDGKQFISLSENQILISSDGINWDKRVVHSYGTFDDIAYNGKFYIATKNIDGIYLSRNLVDWEKVACDKKIYSPRVKFINNQFYIVGSYGKVISSSDGVNWITYQSKTNYGFSGVDFNGDVYVAVGGQIIIAQKSDTELSYNYGDVNGDYIIDTADYLILRRYLLGKIELMPSEYWKMTGDVLNDGTIDVGDYNALRKYLLGLTYNIPIYPPI